MDVKKAIDKMRSADQRLAETQMEKTIGAKVLDLVSRGQRVSRSSLLTALHGDEQHHGATLSGLAATAAIKAINKAAAARR